MPARVHGAVAGRPRDTGGLLDRQRVEFGPDRDGRTGPADPDHGAGVGYLGGVGTGQPVQHHRAGAVLAPGHFGVRVEQMPERHHRGDLRVKFPAQLC